MKAVVFDKQYWTTVLWPRIIEENGRAVIISWVCRERLGFTVREHRAPIGNGGDLWVNQTEIHLDFYDEQMRTLFILKYK